MADTLDLKPKLNENNDELLLNYIEQRDNGLNSINQFTFALKVITNSKFVSESDPGA